MNICTLFNKTSMIIKVVMPSFRSTARKNTANGSQNSSTTICINNISYIIYCILYIIYYILYTIYYILYIIYYILYIILYINYYILYIIYHRSYIIYYILYIIYIMYYILYILYILYIIYIIYIIYILYIYTQAATVIFQPQPCLRKSSETSQQLHGFPEILQLPTFLRQGPIALLCQSQEGSAAGDLQNLASYGNGHGNECGGFPSHGGTPNYHHYHPFIDGIFHKPSSYWDTTIYGFPATFSRVDVSGSTPKPFM